MVSSNGIFIDKKRVISLFKLCYLIDLVMFWSKAEQCGSLLLNQLTSIVQIKSSGWNDTNIDTNKNDISKYNKCKVLLDIAKTSICDT